MTVTRLQLDPHQRHRCREGHPWVFRSELDAAARQVAESLADGQVVQIVDRGRAVGAGWYGRRSQIAVRLLTRGETLPDDALVRARIDRALAHRAAIMPGRDACRLISSEGDLLPGFIADRYGRRLVVQATTAAADAHLGLLVDQLRSTLDPEQVVERNDLPVRDLEGVPRRAGVLHGPSDARLTVRIGRCLAEVDLLDPHKTGSYLDQQVNHELAMAHIRPGDRVLDAFCHLGGFALHACAAGAARAVALDQSEASVAGALRAAALNDCADRVEGVAADAFAWLRDAAVRGDRFEVVILDPPSFTRNRDALPAAIRGYRDLHRLALRLLVPGGRLLSYSCSHHVDESAFAQTIADAAADARLAVRLDARFAQAPDHPVLLAVPETRYLHGLAATALAH